MISYYWPPSGGGGVHRWLKMSKYLSDDFDLHVYTPENPEAPAVDNASVSEVKPQIKVVKTPIKEPYQMYKWFTGKKQKAKIYSGFINNKKSIAQDISVWIRGNFFIPDARKWWIKPSVKFLRDYIVKNNIELIISTGPPHSMHMIGLGLKKKIKEIKWVADFRDPWTNIDFYNQLKLSGWADKRHKKMEKEVLENADAIVTVSPSWAKEFEVLSGGREVEIIHNGYDHEDFQGEVNHKIRNELIHVGSMNAHRNPEVLWKALSIMKKDRHPSLQNFKVRLIGSIDYSIKKNIEDYELEELVMLEEFKQHDKIIEEIRSAKILLLVVNDTQNARGILPGKLYEYLAAERPVLAIGPDNTDCQLILSQFSHVDFIGNKDVEKCINILSSPHHHTDMSQHSLKHQKYSRKELAKKYTKLIHKLLVL